MGRDRGEIDRQFAAADRAYRQGDIAALRTALGDPADFPNCRQPFDLGMGEFPLGYAVFWSPLAFIAQLLELGADPNHPADDGFPALFTARSRCCSRMALIRRSGHGSTTA